MDNIFIGLRVLNLRKMDDFGTERFCSMLLFRYQNLWTCYELHCFYFIWLTSHNWALFILPGYVGDDICQYVLSYPATIGLAKREVSIARILAICKPRNSPYTINKHCIPNRQHDRLQACVLDSLDHINRSPNRSRDYN